MKFSKFENKIISVRITEGKETAYTLSGVFSYADMPADEFFGNWVCLKPIPENNELSELSPFNPVFVPEYFPESLIIRISEFHLLPEKTIKNVKNKITEKTATEREYEQKEDRGKSASG